MSKLLSYCPLCAATEIKTMYQARDPHYGISGSYRIVRCANCSLVFLNPMYSDGELTALYPSDYYAYQDEVRGSLWKQRAKKLLGYWQGTREPSFSRPGTFLDIGCGSGAFVERMRDAGWRAQGVEVNEAAARTAQSRDLEVFCGLLQDAQFPSESFDYVRASHSLEHSTCPHETLDEIHRILKPEGTLLIAIPNIDSLSAKIFRQYWFHLCPPVHAFSYSVQTIRRMLELHGFRVRRVVFNSQYEGMLGSAQIWLNRKNGNKSSEGLVFNARPLRIVCGWLERLCDVMRMGDVIEVTAAKANAPESVSRIRGLSETRNKRCSIPANQSGLPSSDSWLVAYQTFARYANLCLQSAYKWTGNSFPS